MRAGPAGLVAAVTLARRGHRVRVWTGPAPGGELRAAATPPGKEEFADPVDAWLAQLDELGADVCRQVATVERLFVHELHGVVVATGADRTLPDLPGLRAHPRALTVLDVARGAEVDDPVVVTEARWEGAEMALLLAARRHRVTVFDADRVGGSLSPVTRRWFTRRLLAEAGVDVRGGCRLLRVAAEGLTVGTADGTRVLPAATLVFEGERHPRRQLADQLAGHMQVVVASDAAAPGSALSATTHGLAAALDLEMRLADRTR